MLSRQIAIIDWLNDAAFDFLNIAARENPVPTQGRKPLDWVRTSSFLGAAVALATARRRATAATGTRRESFMAGELVVSNGGNRLEEGEGNSPGENGQ